MHKVFLYFKSLSLKELLAHLFFSFAIVLNALSALFDFAFQRDSFAIVQSVSSLLNASLLIHYLIYKNLRLITYGLSIIYSIEFTVIMYLEHFALHSYFFPLFLPLVAYLTLSLKESTIMTFVHYTITIFVSLSAYLILHIHSSAFTFEAISAYFFSAFSIIIFGLFYHMTIADGYYKLFNDTVQKEYALGEIHHRLKNNLSVINSMFGIQRISSERQEISELIETNRHRIESIGLIHDILYRKEDGDTIDFETYVDELIDTLFKLSDQPIKFKLKIDKYDFPVGITQQLGIIIHELVTNSLKYAFEDQTNNIILIKLKREGEFFFFTYSDNGKGFILPETNKPKDENRSLGIELIYLAIAQLNGILCRDEDLEKGFNITIKLPVYPTS